MKVDDTISRQAAIDALCDEYCGGWQDCKHYPKCENLKVIQNLPSTQPEIIKCRECTHHKDELPGMVYCPIMVGGWIGEDCFCSWAERRTDG